MIEKWLPVVGCEEIYSISDRGRLKRLGRIGSRNRYIEDRILKGATINGYRAFFLGFGGRRGTSYAHRLVLEMFVGPCPKGMEARHFPDRNKQNNSLNNLSWTLHQQNIDDQLIHETRNRGQRNGNAKLTERDVRAIRAAFRRGVNQAALAKKYDVRWQHVSNIVTRRRWGWL